MRLSRLLTLLALLALPSLLSACAEMPKSPEAQAEAAALDDPLEPMNRTIFDVNDFLDTYFIKPAAEAYRYVVPDYVRERIANVLSNMGEPVIFANNMMQGEATSGWITTQRFLINTTIGVAGIWEVAGDWGLPKQMGDFGQTLSVWGIKGGPYLVLPLFGPSNFRDALGLGADMAMSPWGYIARMGGQGAENRVQYSEFAADGLTQREQNLDNLDALRAGSLDFYAEMRSVYRQYRDKQLGIQPTSPAPVFEDYE